MSSRSLTLRNHDLPLQCLAEQRQVLHPAHAALMVRAGDAVTSEEAEDDAQAAVSWGEVTRAVPTDQVGGCARGRL